MTATSPYCPPPLSVQFPTEAKEATVSTDAPRFVAGRIQYWKGPTVLCGAQSRLGDNAPRIDWAGRDTAYRLSTVENMDRVYVLDDGRVIESGSYHELRSRENGEFRNMVEKQSL